jgi:hypothetical protein
MGLTVKETGGSSYAPLEAGTYPARCVGVIDLGVQHSDYTGKDSERVRIIWELPTETTEVDGVAKPRWMSKPYTASLHEKASLRKDLDSWRGKPFTPEELAGFSLRNIVNAPCLLTIVHQTGTNGNTYAKVGAISKIMKGMEVADLATDPIVFDMDDLNAEDVLTQLPEWMQDEVKASITWQERQKEILPFEMDDEDNPF